MSVLIWTESENCVNFIFLILKGYSTHAVAVCKGKSSDDFAFVFWELRAFYVEWIPPMVETRLLAVLQISSAHPGSGWCAPFMYCTTLKRISSPLTVKLTWQIKRTCECIKLQKMKEENNQSRSRIVRLRYLYSDCSLRQSLTSSLLELVLWETKMITEKKNNNSLGQNAA